MKIVKHYWFVAIALITMISFSSCESDEERGFDISGLYGKTWWGDMGFEDRYGEPFTVTSHSPQVLSQIMV
nr:hypothetical protein [Phocaeicola vulgatus]